MSDKDLKKINRLAVEAEKAAKTAVRNRFLIETYLSFLQAKLGKGREHKSVSALFSKLGI